MSTDAMGWASIGIVAACCFMWLVYRWWLENKD
jgi:hypothetical protein